MSQVDLTPFHRVGLVEPDLRKLLLIACASRVYHVMQLQHLELALSAHSPSGGPIPLYESILDLAVVLLRELIFHSAFDV